MTHTNYWTSSDPYDEVFYYIKNNIGNMRDDIALMASGEKLFAQVTEYSATSLKLETKELMDKFDELLMEKEAMGYDRKTKTHACKVEEL